MFVWPVAALARRALTMDSARSPGALLERTHAWHLLAVTLGQAAASTILAVAVAAPIVWLYARVSGAVLVILTVVVTIPFVLPTVVVGVAFRALIDGPLAFAHIGFGWRAVLMAHVFLNVAVVVRVVGGAWRALDTRAVDAARTLGAGRWRAWRTVVAPRLLPAVGAAATLVFLFCSTSFGVILILGGGALRTLETEIYTQAIGYFQIPAAVALSMLQVVVVVAALMICALFRSQSAIGSAGPSRRRTPIGPLTRIAVGAVSVFTVVVLAGPIAVLAVRSVRPRVGGAWTLVGYRALADPVNGVTPLATLRYSFLTAVLATLIAIIIGALAALALHRTHGLLRSVGDVVSMIPLGVSAVTLGFGYLIILAALPSYVGYSAWVIPCVQALLAVPVVIRIVLPALESVSVRQRQAAAVLGAAPLRVFATIELPVIGRSLGAAGGFAFVMALGEFGATSFLARADTTTLPVLIGSALNHPGANNLATAMAASMLLVAATAVAVAITEVAQPRFGAVR
ncbi:MAG: ABC transporter permease subunit [Gordonia sp. (in: high G+C Gram-positive bacteria)]